MAIELKTYWLVNEGINKESSQEADCTSGEASELIVKHAKEVMQPFEAGVQKHLKHTVQDSGPVGLKHIHV